MTIIKKIIPITAGAPQHSGSHLLCSHWKKYCKSACCLPLGQSHRDPQFSSIYSTGPKKTVISSALLNLEPKLIKQPTCLHPSVFIHFWAFWHGTVLLERLVAEEIVTQEAATELLQEAQDIPDAVHYQQAQEMLLPLKRSWNWKASRSKSIPGDARREEGWEQGKSFHTSICMP